MDRHRWKLEVEAKRRISKRNRDTDSKSKRERKK